MNKRKILLTVVLLSLFTLSLFAKENAISIGGKKGWDGFSAAKNVALAPGRFGYDSVQIATNARQVTNRTDLLLSFEENDSTDLSGNYSVVSSKVLYTENAKMGKRSAFSNGDGGIKLRGKEGTIFGGETTVASFTLDFWLLSSLAENGETLFSWRSSKNVDGRPTIQLITANFINNCVEWRFSNVFFNRSQGTEIFMRSHTPIIPQKWLHHVLTYDDETGLIEYTVDGKIEAVYYATETKNEGSAVLTLEIGFASDVELMPSFTGCMDDFRIIRGVENESRFYYTYKAQGGRFESQPLATTGIGSKMNSISVVDTVPPQTEIRYFVRAGDNMFDWTDTFPVWKSVTPGENIHGISGRYFQVAADLYTDGLGVSTPSVTEIIIRYKENRPPVPPYKVFAKAKDGEVELSWASSADGSAKGYLVYYGEHPGEYLGTTSTSGISPIDVKNQVNVTISGLENGRIYYFAVASYGDEDANVVGALSKEVYARPLALQ